MTTRYGAAPIEIIESLNDSVESLNIEKVKYLLANFNFDEQLLKQLTINKLENNVELSILLLSKTSKHIKEEVLEVLKTHNTHLYDQLHERIDL